MTLLDVLSAISATIALAGLLIAIADLADAAAQRALDLFNGNELGGTALTQSGGEEPPSPANPAGGAGRGEASGPKRGAEAGGDGAGHAGGDSAAKERDHG